MTQPAPLTPPDADLRDFQFMPVEPGRLFGSEFHALADDTAWRAGVTLWLRSWHQVPAASLPDDDVALARLAELGRDLKTWRLIKDAAMRGWVKCSDGRLYHPVVAEKALEAWIEKLLQRVSSAAGNAKRWGVGADIDAINADISRATDLLTAIAPQSRSLAKLARRQSRFNPTGNATGTDSDPTGSPECIPAQSQETGTEKGQGQGSIRWMDGARAREEIEVEEPSPERIALDRIAAACGFVITDANEAEQLDVVMGWIGAGISADTITQAIAKALPTLEGPTHSLARFAKIVRHAHAQQQAAAPTAKAQRDKGSMLVKFDDEDAERFAPIRQALVERADAAHYSLFAESVRFKADGTGPGGGEVLRVLGKPLHVQQFDNSPLMPALRRIAADHGFSHVWA